MHEILNRNTMLLERDAALEALGSALNQVEGGLGCTVAVLGEAGAGKSTLVNSFIRSVAERVELFRGGCENYSTARPLGPLYDMARALGESVNAELHSSADPHRVFDAVLNRLRQCKKTGVVVIEDAHWADAATYDLIRFLARRIAALPILLVVTFRSDEIGVDHPLRLTLGDIAGPNLRRIALAELSEAAVGVLVRQFRPEATLADIATVYATTQGNPFFTTEVAANLSESLPNSVRDAILSRLGRLPPAARDLLNAASTVPRRISTRELLSVLGEGARDALGLCLECGFLVECDQGFAVQFRHELSRLAVEAALSPSQRPRWHTALWEANQSDASRSSAQLLHHALALHATDDIYNLALAAAAQSARLGAHREAAAHHKTALAYAHSRSVEERVALHERWSYEQGLVQIDDAVIAARHSAIDLWRVAGNDEKIALNLRWLSRLHWYRGESVKAQALVSDALTTRRELPAS